MVYVIVSQERQDASVDGTQRIMIFFPPRGGRGQPPLLIPNPLALLS